jgi:undecaprenyl-diphosphatase
MEVYMAFSNINSYLFTIINNMAGNNALIDKTMVFTAKYLVYIVPIYLLYLWFIPRSDKSKKASIYIFLAVIVSLSIGWIITLFYFHPRPFMIGLGKELFQHSKETSFPSDHATVMFAVSFALFFLKDIKNGIVFFILATLVGFARVFCGVHYPFDILGALIVALLGTVLISLFKKQLDFLFSRGIEIYNKILLSVFKKTQS